AQVLPDADVLAADKGDDVFRPQLEVPAECITRDGSAAVEPRHSSLGQSVNHCGIHAPAVQDEFINQSREKLPVLSLPDQARRSGSIQIAVRGLDETDGIFVAVEKSRS